MYRVEPRDFTELQFLIITKKNDQCFAMLQPGERLLESGNYGIPISAASQPRFQALQSRRVGWLRNALDVSGAQVPPLPFINNAIADNNAQPRSERASPVVRRNPALTGAVWEEQVSPDSLPYLLRVRPSEQM